MAIKTVEEAKAFFLTNSEGTITCENAKGEEKTVSTFPDAEAFLIAGGGGNREAEKTDEAKPEESAPAEEPAPEAEPANTAS